MSIQTQSTGTDRQYFGVVEAVVIDNIDPDGEGRVKLVYPWFDEVSHSDWCRVCQFYAGPSTSGAFFVPEIDSEVLVAFVHGDMRHPIVVGSLYNGVDKPATKRESNRDEKQLLTRSGHRITLVDTEGEEKIVIVEKSGSHSIEISTVDNGITIKAQGGSLKFEADNIEFNAKSGFTIEASSIETKATGDIVIKGSTINLN